MIKCCIFDLDGTILDTISTITHFVNVTFQNNGIEPICEDECKYFVGNGARLLIVRALKSKGIDDPERIEKILAEYNSTYDNDPLYLTSPFKGIPELLATLSSHGIKLAVLSNKPDSTVKSLVKHFFGDVFDIIIGGMDGVPLKPDPTAPRKIIGELGVSADGCAWVGDTSIDIETGKNLGVALNIGVLWGFRKYEELSTAGADVIVSSADEILTAVLSA